MGLSLPSTTRSVLVAQVPNSPTSVTTVADGTNIRFQWNAPDDGGSQITGYDIFIQNSDGLTYSQNLQYCDGGTATVISETKCSIPKSTLNR